MHRDSLTPAPLEKFLLERAPVVLATQERFKLFLAENQKSVANGQHLATIPCGMMGELLYLNYTGIDHIKLTGIDYDEATLGDAKHLASQQHLLPFTDFLQKDAWHLGIQNQFDLISSNGLNIYEADDEKVYEIYKQFYIALKPGGKLVTSYLTPPPVISNHCEWNLTQVNQEDLLMQKIIFADIVGTNWQHFRSTETTRNQLIKAGFTEINIIPDKANIFPTVTAIK
jgi:SAM-dependent methyltransferase